MFGGWDFVFSEEGIVVFKYRSLYKDFVVSVFIYIYLKKLYNKVKVIFFFVLINCILKVSNIVRLVFVIGGVGGIVLLWGEEEYVE